MARRHEVLGYVEPDVVILGCGGSTHDLSTCVLQDGEIVLAIEVERLTRVRYAINSSCRDSLGYCLTGLGLSADDVEVVYANDAIERHLLHPFENEVAYLGHHQAHAYSAFFTSPPTEAAILVADGCGSVTKPGRHAHLRETTSYYYGDEETILLISRVEGEREGSSDQNPVDALTSDSLGDFYEAITSLIGFGVLQAGRTMALAAFGDDRHYELFSDFVHLLPKGQFRINLHSRNGLVPHIRELLEGAVGETERFFARAHIASACQFWLEELLVHCLNYLYEETLSSNLCFSGGVAHNCVFNSKIRERTKFKNVYISFAPSDSGTAFGAAIYGYQQKTCSARKFMPLPYLGKEYSQEEIVSAIRDLRRSLRIRESKDICVDTAHYLNEGRIVGWFQGGSEFGPRALGNRSIIASPTRPNMKNILNTRVKHREFFRPYAPAILAEFVTEYFDHPTESRFMQFIAYIKDELRNHVPAVCHVDGSARLQTVTADDNPLFYRLISEFYEVSGIPLLLNTSFNSRGRPIVETPYDAIQTFLETDMDVLVLKDFIIEKRR